MAAARPYRPAADADASPGQRFASRAASASAPPSPTHSAASAPPSAYLQVQGGDGGTTRMVPLGTTPVRIGRGIQCEVRLAQVGLGDIQCMIRRRGDEWHFQPIGPPGRIWIDGRPADSQRAVAVGALIQVGRSTLTIHEAGSDPSRQIGSFDAPITVGGDSTPAPEPEPTPEPELAFEPKPAPTSGPTARLAEPEADEPDPTPDSEEGATTESPAADRARRWQSRLDQRDRWLRDRQDEKRWEARWRAAGESIRARSGRPEATPRPPSPEPTPTPPPAPPSATQRPSPARPPIVRPAEPRPVFGPRMPRPEPTAPPEPIRPEPVPSLTPTAKRPEPAPPAEPIVEVPSTPPSPPVVVVGRTLGPIRTAPIGREASRPPVVTPAAPIQENPEAPAPRPVAPIAEAPALVEAPLDAPDSSVGRDLAPPTVADPPRAEQSPAPAALEPSTEDAPTVGAEAPTGPDFDEVEDVLAGFAAPTEVTPAEAPASAEPISPPAPARPTRTPAAEAKPTAPALAPVSPPVAPPPTAPAAKPAEPLDAPVHARAVEGVEWPTARAIFAAQATRALNPDAEGRSETPAATDGPARPRRRARPDPEPTPLVRPAAWSVPAWLGAGVAALMILSASFVAIPLALVWMQDDLGGAEAVRLATRPEGTRAPFLASDGEALTRTAWWQTTAGHLAAWALTLGRLGPGEDRTADALALEADARAASPLGARARFLSEPPPGAEASDDGTIRLGPTRDVATLSALGGRLRRLGKREEAVRAYREAFRLAATTPRATLGVPPFRDDEQVNRYGLPHSILLDDVARAMVGSGEWTPEEWREAVPAFGPALLAVAEALRADHPGDAERRLDALASLDPDASLDPRFEPAEHRAALGEALAARQRWTDALTRYRSAIEHETRDLDRRVWWFNLAEVARRGGDEPLREEAIENAKGSDLGDEVTKRAAAAHGSASGASGVAHR